MKEKLYFTGEKVLLTLILILSAVLNFANIGIEGYANTFYAAGVKSMMMNLRNFFFASYDPAGFVTIDKPPFGFWIQTIFAKIFGFSGWSIILPQAVAGVLSVWILYRIVKRSFGSGAGLIAALCLAVTPIFVAASRNNTIDNLLVLSLVLACWPLLIAAEKGKLKYLLLSLAIVGIGFNIKMVEAYMVAPAIYITYLLSSALPFGKRIKHLVLGTIVLLTVSLSWAVITDMVPAADRPYIGSSTDNSVIQLIIGHNGLQRVGLGQGNRGFNANRANNSDNRTGAQTNTDNRTGAQTNTDNRTGAQSNIDNRFRMPTDTDSNNNFSGMGEQNSNIGILRLFTKNNMSDQISWLLPLAIIGFIAAAIEEKFKFPFDNKRKLTLLLFFMWLLPEFIYFSFVRSITHVYYLTTMAPSIAALAGIGLTAMWKLFNENGWKKWILPAALIINGFAEILILSYNYNTSKGYRTVILLTGLLGIVFSIILAIANIIRNIRKVPEQGNLKLNKIITAIAFAGILTAPTVWSFTPMFHQMNGSSPSAGLELFSGRQQGYGASTATNNSKLIEFLEANRKNEKYLVEVPSATTFGSDIILKSGEPILTLGGFSGSDPILTLDEFKQLVNDGAIRYAMASTGTGRGVGFGGFGDSNGSNSAIMNWIRENGKVVPDSEWKAASTSEGQNNIKSLRGPVGEAGSVELYDLKPAVKTSASK